MTLSQLTCNRQLFGTIFTITWTSITIKISRDIMIWFDANPIAINEALMGVNRIYLARISSAEPVASAHHLVVNDDVDAFACVPVLALAVINDGNVDHLECFRSDTRTYHWNKIRELEWRKMIWSFSITTSAWNDGDFHFLKWFLPHQSNEIELNYKEMFTLRTDFAAFSKFRWLRQNLIK